MPDLFGLDIAQLVADAIAAAGNLRPGTLTKTDISPDPNDPDTLVTTTTNYAFQGFIEARAILRAETLISETVPVLTIIGASVASSAVPESNDQATLDGITYELGDLVSRDPAAAVYTFRVR